MKRLTRNFGRATAVTLGMTVGLWSLPSPEVLPNVPVRQPGHELLGPGVCAELVKIIGVIGVPGESLLELTALRGEPLGPEMEKGGADLAAVIAASDDHDRQNQLANLAAHVLSTGYPDVENFRTDPESADSAFLVAQVAVMHARGQCSDQTVAVGTNV